MRIIRFAIICAGVLLVGVSPQSAAGQSTPQPVQAAASWSFSTSPYTYIAPGSDYVQPTITADRQWLHLEARYNYEDLETGSLWVGYNFSVGDKIKLDITPMLGGVLARPPASRPAYAVHSDGGGSNSTARASSFSTPANGRTPFSTCRRS
jgi:hypothetical protein